eukprot:GSA120T00003463001.1
MERMQRAITEICNSKLAESELAKNAFSEGISPVEAPADDPCPTRSVKRVWSADMLRFFKEMLHIAEEEVAPALWSFVEDVCLIGSLLLRAQAQSIKTSHELDNFEVTRDVYEKFCDDLEKRLPAGRGAKRRIDTMRGPLKTILARKKQQLTLLATLSQRGLRRPDISKIEHCREAKMIGNLFAHFPTSPSYVVLTLVDNQSAGHGVNVSWQEHRFDFGYATRGVGVLDQKYLRVENKSEETVDITLSNHAAGGAAAAPFVLSPSDIPGLRPGESGIVHVDLVSDNVGVGPHSAVFDLAIDGRNRCILVGKVTFED